MPHDFISQTACINLHGDFSSLYADGDVSSFLYGSSLSASFIEQESQVDITLKYTGITSNVDYASAAVNSFFFSGDLIVKNCKTSFFLFQGEVPEKLSLTFRDKKIIQQSPSLVVTGLSLDYTLSPSLGFGLTGIAATQNTESGELYYLNGNISFPFSASLRINTCLPRDFNFYAGFSYIEFDVYTETFKFGSGSIWEWDASLSKSFFWTKNNTLDVSFGVMSLYGNGKALLLSNMVDYPFFPFTYLRFDGGFNIYLAGAMCDYNYKRGRFNFDSIFALGLNVFSRINCFYKYIYQNTSLYDGSSGKENLSKETFVNDLILYFSLKASYDFDFVSLYAGKKIFVPVLNIHEKNTSESDTSLPDNSEIDRLVKTILLSGIQFGFSIRL